MGVGMIDALKPYLLLIKIAAAIAAVVALVLGWNAMTAHYEQIGYDRAKGECAAEKAREVLAAKVAYDASLKRMTDERKKADHEAEERYKKLAADYASLRNANLGLRSTVSDLRGKLSAASADALRATSAAALDVFDECTDELVEVAKAADGHAADVRTLTEAWPK